MGLSCYGEEKVKLGLSFCRVLCLGIVKLPAEVLYDLCTHHNTSSGSDNNTSDSANTSQISTSKEIYYDFLEYKGPPKSLLKWYGYLSDEYKDNGRFWGSKSGGNESDAKHSFSDISKAKACMLAKAQASDASSKAKVQACGSKAKLQTSPKTFIVKSPVPITNYVLGLANAKTRDAILSKTFGVKIPLNYGLYRREERKEED
ncbi:hypothetical protein Tco_1255922 [Tanacetum coccineum]